MTEKQKRFQELADRSNGKGYAIYSDFLGLAEISELSVMRFSVPTTLWGGYDDAERCVACFGDREYFTDNSDYPIDCICIKPVNQKFADNLTHRDFLGSLMGLGIRREVIGDIIISDNCGYLFCLDTITDYIIRNLTQVRHTTVECNVTERIPQNALPQPENSTFSHSNMGMHNQTDSKNWQIPEKKHNFTIKGFIIRLGIIIIIVTMSPWIIRKIQYYQILREEKIAFNRQIKMAQEAETAEEACNILRNVIAVYNKNKHNVSEAKALLKKYKYKYEREIIIKEVELARKAETYDEAFDILENIIARYSGKNDVSEAKALLKKLKNAQVRVPSAEAIKKIQFNNPKYFTQIQIEKKINLNNECAVYIFPMEYKDTVNVLLQKMNMINKYVREHTYYFTESNKKYAVAKKMDDSNYKKIEIQQKAIEDIRKGRRSLENAQKYFTEFNEILNNFSMDYMRNFLNPKIHFVKLENNSCDISEVYGPVILFVYEIIKYNKMPMPQGWVLEYEPFAFRKWVLE